MMEVIPINTNEHVALKADLWAERIRAFQKSGLSRKDWCQQNEIPQSTLSFLLIGTSNPKAEQELLYWKMMQKGTMKLQPQPHGSPLM